MYGGVWWGHKGGKEREQGVVWERGEGEGWKGERGEELREAGVRGGDQLERVLQGLDGSK